MKHKKIFLKEAIVLFITTILVITTLVSISTATSTCSSTILLYEDFSGAFPPAGWTTDCWTHSYTNEAGGTVPEAKVHKYDQYYQGQYYDNYIMTPYFDASACNSVVLEFNFAADVLYPDYCYFNVMYREDAASPWVDITPWTNPLTGNFQGYYVISINCGGGGCGTAFQVKWEFIGYYYYYNNFYLDDVKIICCDQNNQPPGAPTISGPSNGNVNVPYTYTFTSVDPDGDDVSYYINWGDGTYSGWTECYPSGNPYTETHTWVAKGTYVIQAIARDCPCELEGPESTYSVTIPRDKAIKAPFLQFLDSHSNFLPLLRQLFGL